MPDIYKKIKNLEEKRNAFAAKIKELERKAKNQERKLDARRKIIAGAVLLKYFESTNQKELLIQILSKALTNSEDRKLFNLKELENTQPEES